jgi:hypothetical protein
MEINTLALELAPEAGCVTGSPIQPRVQPRQMKFQRTLAAADGIAAFPSCNGAHDLAAMACVLRDLAKRNPLFDLRHDVRVRLLVPELPLVLEALC